MKNDAAGTATRKARRVGDLMRGPKSKIQSVRTDGPLRAAHDRDTPYRFFSNAAKGCAQITRPSR